MIKKITISFALAACVFATGACGAPEYTMRTQAKAEADLYEYAIRWPEFSTANAELNAELNTAASNAAFTDLRDFLLHVQDIKDEFGADSESAWFPFVLHVESEITLFDKNFVSMRFQTMIHTGGAHPNHYSRSLVFDIHDAANVGFQQIKLEEMFDENTLEQTKPQVLGLVRDKLEEQAAAWTNDIAFGDGTFTLEKNGIALRFDPYAVGPYSAGTFDVLLTWNEVREYLKPDVRARY